MYWLCYEEYRNGRLAQSWIIESDTAPDAEDENGERPYPFNGMDGYVLAGYGSEKRAAEAEDILWRNT